MASGIQVRNVKAFEFDKMVVNWDGCQYPFRELIYSNAPYYTFVSVKELECKLLDKNGIAVNVFAEWIDNQIAYYVDSVEQLNLSNIDLYNLIYTE